MQMVLRGTGKIAKSFSLLSDEGVEKMRNSSGTLTRKTNVDQLKMFYTKKNIDDLFTYNFRCSSMDVDVQRKDGQHNR